MIYVHKNNSFKVVDKRSLKAIAEKSQKPCPPELKAKLEAALSTPEVIEEDTAPTAEQISANTFTGLAPTPKPTGTPTGKTPESTVLELNDGVKRGDFVRVTTKDSIASGKTVEVGFVKADGTIKFTWDGKIAYVPASGYELE